MSTVDTPQFIKLEGIILVSLFSDAISTSILEHGHHPMYLMCRRRSAGSPCYMYNLFQLNYLLNNELLPCENQSTHWSPENIQNSKTLAVNMLPINLPELNLV